MKQINEKIDMGNFTTIEVNEFDELIVTFDDGDLMFELPLEAKDVLKHLTEYFNK